MSPRVLIVDDSALVRQVLTAGLDADPDITVVGSVDNPYAARDAIVKLEPNVLTLDVEMPRMDGLEFLRRLMPQYPLPVVMVSALTERGKEVTLQALEAGAVDFVPKPSAQIERGLGAMMMELRTKVKIAAIADVSHWKSSWRPRSRSSHTALAGATDQVVVIGASTGGTEAIRQVICDLPRSMPGIVIVQHMPMGFTRMYAERLNRQARLHVKEAVDGERILPGKVLIAPGEQQARIVRRGGEYRMQCGGTELVSGHCPSVDVLMHSAARALGRNAVGVMLTGMGSDGAEGMLAMRKAGASTLAQDEASCVVFGMPKEAHRAGGVETLLPLGEIAGAIIERLETIRTRAA